MNTGTPNRMKTYLESTISAIGRRLIIFHAVMVIAAQMILMAIPYVIGRIVDSLRSAKMDQTAIIGLPALWAATYFAAYIVTRITSEVIQRTRLQSKISVYGSYLMNPESYFVTHDPGRWAHYLEAISFSTRYLLGEGLPLVIRTIATALLGAVIAGTSVPIVGALTLLWAFIYAPLSVVIARHSVRNAKLALASSADVSGLAQDILTNHELVKAFHREQDEITRFAGALDNEMRTYKASQRRIDRGELLQKLLLVFMPVSVAVYLFFGDAVSPGDAALLLSLTLLMTSSLSGFGKSILAVFEHAERLRGGLDAAEIMVTGDTPATAVPSPNRTLTANVDSWRIETNGLSFGYSDSRKILRNINLTIEKGEKVGIVGFSGSGKTTLLRLVRGAYSPDSGTVTIGGEPIAAYPSEIRGSVVLEVNRSAGIFHRSLRENLNYGLGERNENSLMEAVENAQLGDVIAKLPEGLDTVIGVKGETLSMGEQARVSIARAFLCDPKIILLDEIFASLDSENEDRIRRALGLLSKNRTVVAVAHRLFTIHMMERIIVMDNGNIVSDGSHETLMRGSELYRRMYEAQRLA